MGNPNISDIEQQMASYIKKIATGPQMSKDLTLEEAREGMSLVLDGLVSNVQAAVFLIALRMKRETDEENRGILEALRCSTRFMVAPVPELVDLADPYDGFNRHLPASSFLPAVLAATGMPSILHGCHQLAPKYGVTHHQILSAAGVRVDFSTQQAAYRLADTQIGWVYVDQKVFSPSLHRLVELRRLMVKRPCLSTLEKLCGPIRAQHRNHLTVGYVHKDYQRLLPLMARHAGYHSALVIRGIEGGIVPPLNVATPCTFFTNGRDDRQMKCEPMESGIESTVRAVPLPPSISQPASPGEDETSRVDAEALAHAAAKEGLETLEGKSGPTRDSLIYTGALILSACGKFQSIRKGADAVREAIDSGIALMRFQTK